MSWNKIKPALFQLGYCCPFAFFSANRSVSTSELAKQLGVTSRTVRYARSRFAANAFTCRTNRQCLRIAAQELQKHLPSKSASPDVLPP